MGETNKNINMVGNLNAPLTAVDGSSKQKINTEILALNDTLDQMDISTFTEPFIPEHQIICSSLAHLEHCQGYTIWWDTRLALTNLRRFKSALAG